MIKARMGIRSVITLGIATVILMSLPFASLAKAQEGAVARSSSPADASLQAQMDKLQQGQEKIIKEITGIIQLLQGTLTAVPSNPLQPPPSTLIVQNQAFRGNNGATVAIVEYADFECPYCGEYAHIIYPQIAKDYIETGKVKYFFRDLPLPMHPHAMGAARAARCAGEQGKFWEMHDSLFAKQNTIRDVDMPDHAQELGLDTAKFAACLSSDRHTDEINQSAADAQKMGIGGTPTFFVGKVDPNGDVTNLRMIIGARPYDDFKSVIEESLAAKPAAQQ
jgi:protein-disulfide isomerase